MVFLVFPLFLGECSLGEKFWLTQGNRSYVRDFFLTERLIRNGGDAALEISEKSNTRTHSRFTDESLKVEASVITLLVSEWLLRRMRISGDTHGT